MLPIHYFGAMMSQHKPPVRWTPHHDPYTKYRAAFSVAYMNNTKWYTILTALGHADLNIRRVEWKFLDMEDVLVRPFPALPQIQPWGLADGYTSPVAYKWITWVRFPRHYRPQPMLSFTVEQNLPGIYAILTSCGQLQLDYTDTELIVYGYGK